jgi:hypothetical protein
VILGDEEAQEEGLDFLRYQVAVYLSRLPCGRRGVIQAAQRLASPSAGSGVGSGLEAFSHTPAHGSVFPLAFRPGNTPEV